MNHEDLRHDPNFSLCILMTFVVISEPLVRTKQVKTNLIKMSWGLSLIPWDTRQLRSVTVCPRIAICF